MRGSNVGRQVQPVEHEQVGPQVLQVIGQLQRRAGRVGECQPLGVVDAEELEHEPADGVGAAAAVAQEPIEGVVPVHPLVLLEGVEQVVERGPGQAESADRGLQQRKQAAVRGFRAAAPAVERSHPAAEFGQPAEVGRGVARPVRRVVGRAAEAIHRREGRPQARRHQPRHHGKVLPIRSIGGCPGDGFFGGGPGGRHARKLPEAEPRAPRSTPVRVLRPIVGDMPRGIGMESGRLVPSPRVRCGRPGLARAPADPAAAPSAPRRGF